MRIVIIGGEAAGMSAAAKARRLNKHAEIVVYEASEIVSFGACGLPYYIGGHFQQADAMAEFTAEQFQQKGIQVNINSRVIHVDPEKRQLTILVQGNKIEDHYDRLMIATGAKERLLPLPGADLLHIYTLRRLADGIAIKQALASAEIKSVAVIGSGFIGLELVEALRQQEKQVHLFELDKRVIPGAFDSEISPIIEKELLRQGIQLHLAESVTAFRGEQRLQAVETTKGEYSVDLAILCIGVQPNTDFVRHIGLDMLPNGAIRVDRTGKTSLTDIYSAGDCASVWHQVSQQDVYVPLATIANKFGRLVGENLAGEQRIFPGTLASAMLKVFDLEVGRTGVTETEAIASGMKVSTVIVQDKNHTNYYPGQQEIQIKLVYHADSKVLLGAQIIGGTGSALRLHALSVAITAGLTTAQLGMVDFGYAPPFNRTWDILNIAANVAK